VKHWVQPRRAGINRGVLSTYETVTYPKVASFFRILKSPEHSHFGKRPEPKQNRDRKEADERKGELRLGTDHIYNCASLCRERVMMRFSQR
jgi:hypothetical protein